MKRRTAVTKRDTSETQIGMEINLDGTGKRKIDTPVGFLNHMLDLFSKHSLIDLEVRAKGDTFIDEHHTVEDIGIVLGEAILKALGDKKGVNRYGFYLLPTDEKFTESIDGKPGEKNPYGFFVLPMDEALATVAIDFAGRYSFTFDAKFINPKVGDLSTDLIWHFWDAFAQNAKVNLYIKVEQGKNDHHIAEAMFKAVARAIRMAIEIDPRVKNQIPSTKGKL